MGGKVKNHLQKKKFQKAKDIYERSQVIAGIMSVFGNVKKFLNWSK
jgi:hypothetical protein